MRAGSERARVGCGSFQRPFRESGISRHALRTRDRQPQGWAGLPAQTGRPLGRTSRNADSDQSLARVATSVSQLPLGGCRRSRPPGGRSLRRSPGSPAARRRRRGQLGEACVRALSGTPRSPRYVITQPLTASIEKRPDRLVNGGGKHALPVCVGGSSTPRSFATAAGARRSRRDRPPARGVPSSPARRGLSGTRPCRP